MSTSRGSGSGNGGGVQPIPAGSRKMVQSLKEIVNCSDAEIYAALKDCNMDPNEAVNRLLSQDPFHEVKSKREKKKEGKDTDSRPRGSSNNTSRGNKSAAERYGGRSGSTPHNLSESGPRQIKASHKKENGSAPYTGSSSLGWGVSGDNRSRGMTGLSNGTSAENESSLLGTGDVMLPVGIQPSSTYQSAWNVTPGQVSMADIVKRGRPHSMTSNAPKASNSNVLVPPSNSSHDNVRFPEDQASRDPASIICPMEQVPTHDEWPIIDKPVSKVISMPEVVHFEKHQETFCVPSDSINQQYEVEEFDETEDESINHSEVNDAESDSISTGKLQEDDSRGASLFESNLYENMGSYHNQAQEVHADEDIGVSMSSVTRNLHQLSVEEDDRSPEGCVPSVVIPDHLQVQSVDCSHLSFGSFGSGINATYSSSGTVTSLPEKSNLEEPHVEADISTVGPPDSRMSEYYADDSLGNVSDGGLFHSTGVTAGAYETSVSKPEELKPENSEVAHGNQFPFPSPNSGYTFDDSQHLNTAFNEASSQMQNLSPFSNVMSYTNSLPSTLSSGNAHPSRESDLHQYSQFPVSQALSAKYGSPSIGGPAVSLSEALKTAAFSSTQPAPHSLSGSNVAGGPPLPQQHLPVHPYSQHTLPLGPFTNMIGYPFLPQSYTYMPSAFQQTFAGNNTYHQSLPAAVLPQYKNNISANSLPQSAAVASGYGALGNNTIPGNFPMNTPTAPSATALNYDDVLSSQYKEASHMISLQQQSENSAMWLHGPNSRGMSAVPGSTYYNNYPGQNHQGGGGFRQSQQPSQNYGALGYPNIYHSQTNISLDQQPNPRDGSLGGPQGQLKQSQIWPNSY